MARKKLSVADEAVEDVAVEQPPEQPEIVAQIKPEILIQAKSAKQRCVELIAEYRKAQVQSMQFRKVGDHISGFINDAEMCKTAARPGKGHNESPRVVLNLAIETAKPELQAKMAAWAEFKDAHILSFIEGNPCHVVSNDGRKYLVDLESGKVS